MNIEKLVHENDIEIISKKYPHVEKDEIGRILLEEIEKTIKKYNIEGEEDSRYGRVPVFACKQATERIESKYCNK